MPVVLFLLMQMDFRGKFQEITIYINLKLRNMV